MSDVICPKCEKPVCANNSMGYPLSEFCEMDRADICHGHAQPTSEPVVNHWTVRAGEHVFHRRDCPCGEKWAMVEPKSNEPQQDEAAPAVQRAEDPLAGLIERAKAVSYFTDGNLHLENTTERDLIATALRVLRVLRDERIDGAFVDHDESVAFWIFTEDRRECYSLDEAERLLFGEGGKPR